MTTVFRHWMCQCVTIICLLIFFSICRGWKMYLEIEEASLKLKLFKWTFLSARNDNVGHIINQHDIHPSANKAKVIVDRKVPTSLDQVWSFLRLAGFYPSLPTSRRLLTLSLCWKKKDVPFIWTSAQDDIFRTLNRPFVEVPVLSLPDFDHAFIIHTDTCKVRPLCSSHAGES